jgi:hypothetical protein
MKKIINIILVFIGIAPQFSCDDFLDRPPIDFLDPQNFFRSEGELRTATLNTYIYLDGKRCLELEHFTDNCYGKKNGDAISYTHGTHTPALSVFKETWEEYYKGINQANLVINAEISEDISPDVIDGYLGDAYFMRAFYYAELLFHYGEVPVITGSPSVTGDIFPAKNTIDEVKDQVLNDLDEALMHLPVDPEKGRAGLGAANMLKAKVHIFFDEFQDARDAAKAVIDLQKYELFGDYRTLFYAENEAFNKEVIFSIQYVETLRPNSFYQVITNGTQYSPSLSLANEFEMANGMAIEEEGSGFDPQKPYLNRDPRLNATLLIPGDSKIIDGVETPVIGRAPKSKTGMLCDKYANWEESYEFYNGSDFILMRYADLLLLYAEALNELEATPGVGVYEAVNEVRDRVNLPHLMAGLSKDEMRAKIRHERRVELAMEGLRLFDIFRWEIGEEAYVPLDGYNPNKLKNLDNLVFEVESGVDKDRSFNPTKGYFWPIPQTEIDLNENLIQNPGFVL